ncbi:hypothetical protein IMSAGC012_03445 [Lachnospiraceae bacterium]|nr:hypothetical protein IMSAGC012_03445 [Lachnospiraceae bacterium]
MTAGLRSFGNNGIRAALFHHPRHGNACNNGNHFDPRFFPHFHISRRISRPRRNCRYAFFDYNVCYLRRIGIHQHHIYAKGFVGQIFDFPDLFPDDFRRGACRTDDAQSPGVRYGCRQVVFRHPRHAALKDRIPDSQ